MTRHSTALIVIYQLQTLPLATFLASGSGACPQGGRVTSRSQWNLALALRPLSRWESVAFELVSCRPHLSTGFLVNRKESTVVSASGSQDEVVCHGMSPQRI